MGIPRALSMKLASEFARVKSGGESFAGKNLVLSVMGDADLAGQQFGFVVPKRVGKAVSRNKVKRRLREIVRESSARLKPDYFFVTIARFRAASATHEELKKEWHWLARRAGVWLQNGTR